MAFRIAYVVPREEYDAFRLLLKDDLAFPTAYEEWAKQHAAMLKKRRAQGEVREMTVHAEEFADWCRRSGVNPSVVTLEAFTVAKAHGKG